MRFVTLLCNVIMLGCLDLSTIEGNWPRTNVFILTSFTCIPTRLPCDASPAMLCYGDDIRELVRVN